MPWVRSRLGLRGLGLGLGLGLVLGLGIRVRDSEVRVCVIGSVLVVGLGFVLRLAVV